MLTAAVSDRACYHWKGARRARMQKGGRGSTLGPVILIRQTDLVSLEARTPYPVIPFPEYIDMMSSPHSDNFTILADTPPVTLAYDNFTMWECFKPGCRTSRDIAVSEVKSQSGLGTTHPSVFCWLLA